MHEYFVNFAITMQLRNSMPAKMQLAHHWENVKLKCSKNNMVYSINTTLIPCFNVTDNNSLRVKKDPTSVNQLS